LRHQRLVDLDHLVDQCLMGGGDRREIRVARGVEEAVDDLLSATSRQIDRQAFAAECGLDRLQRALEVDVVGIDLVDDHQPAQPTLRGPVHHPRRDHFDPRCRAHDDRGGLDGIEGANRLADEVRIAGGYRSGGCAFPACPDGAATHAANADTFFPADRCPRP
jgi:hypothetical protein